jgi:Xaa-Pro aminopeptidase
VSTTSSTTRPDRLLDRLAEAELDALLVTDLVNVRYLTGFTGSNGFALLGRETRAFVSDFRYVEQAADEVEGWDFVHGPRDILDALPDLLGDGEVRLGYEDGAMSVRQYEALEKKLPPSIELAAAGSLVEALRAVKDPEELARIRAACELADDALREILAEGLVGRTETEVALALTFAQRRRGAEDVSFPPIVAAGPHGALPHAKPQDVVIPAGTLVVLDWGARLDGYCSDCTRTVATGEGLPDGAREVYDLVLRAQLAGLEAVTAGAEARAADSAARAPIIAAGHGDHFGHGLGHGVGLDIHEAPRLGQAAEGVLAAGEVVSVEPGVYLPGAFGVRIEDLVAVTDGAPDLFTGLPKELTVVG